MFVTVFSCILQTGWLSNTNIVIYLVVVGYVTEEVKGIALFNLCHVKYLKWTMINLSLLAALKMRAVR